MLTAHEISIRVRYCETDAMGFLHHAQFVNYYEMGRTELLRAQGGNYRDVEASGLFLVVVKLECRYHSPARYDDLLTLRTQVERISAAKIEHSYRLSRGEQLLATASSVLACVDKSGRVQRLPESLSTHDPAEKKSGDSSAQPSNPGTPTCWLDLLNVGTVTPRNL